MTAKSKKLVLAWGLFNTLHPGHLRFLQYGADLGTLVVSLEDPLEVREEKNLVDIEQRKSSLRTLPFVDEVHSHHRTLLDALEEVKPNTLLRGPDQTLTDDEARVVRALNCEVVLTSGRVISGADKWDNQPRASAQSSSKSLRDFLERHGVDRSKVAQKLKMVNSLRVMVIGDIIVDDYVSCVPLGMSQEDPTLVVRPMESKRFLGGAGIIALHASRLGAQVKLLSCVGRDKPGMFSAKKLRDHNVETAFFGGDSWQTVTKKRFRASGKTLLRVNEYSERILSAGEEDQLIDTFRQCSESLDLLIFADFGFGTVTDTVLDVISREALQKNITVSGDSQTSSRTGDVSRFKSIDLLSPTEYEARVALHQNKVGLVALAEELRARTRVKHILLTLGEEGLLVHTSNGSLAQDGPGWSDDRIPALSNFAVDPAGAGDSLLVATSIGLALGLNIWEAAYLGSLAAQSQVEKVGNYPLDPAELASKLSSPLE